VPLLLDRRLRHTRRVTYPSDPNNPSGGGYQGYPAPPPAGGYAGYPGYPAAQPPGRTRGTRAVQVGAILMAAGIVIAIIGGVIGGKTSDSKVNGFQRVALADKSGSITFKDSGGYIAYYESKSVSDSTNQKVPLIEVTLTPTNGPPVNLTTPYGNRSDGKIKYLHYDHDGHKGLAMWQFHIDQSGTYKVDLQDRSGVAAADAGVAFGKSIASSQAATAIVFGFGGLLLVAGLIVLIVGFVKQRRHRRELRAGYGGAQPAGWPQAGPPNWPGGGQPTQQWPAQPGDSQQGWPPPPDQR